MDRLKDIRLLSLNTNSLNLSTYNKTVNGAKCLKFKSKIEAILSLDCNVYFLQDIRANNNIKIMKNYLLNHPSGEFTIYENSSMDRRGVAILIKNDLNLKILNIIKDVEENYILIKAQLEDKCISFGSIYGPNTANEAFYINLTRDINALNADYNLIAGDFNVINSNIDRINYVGNVPGNQANKRFFSSFCDNTQLCDVFRMLYNDTLRFSYRKYNSNYMSRLDLFLSTIPVARQSNIDYLSFIGSLFDHAPLKITFNNNIYDTNQIKISDCKLSKFLGGSERGRISIISTFIDNISTDNRTLDNFRIIFNGIWEKYLRVNSLYCFILRTNLRSDKLLNQIIHDLLEAINNSLNLHFNPNFMDTFPLVCDNDAYFNTICNNLNNDLNNYLNKLAKSENEYIKELINQKNNTCPITDFQNYKRLEKEIDNHYDSLIKLKIERSKYHSCLYNEKASRSFCSLFSNAKKKSSCPSNIKNVDGSNFDSKEDQLTFISNFFKNIYSSKHSSMSIEDFLGDQISNSIPKLNENEKILLDSPLTLQELDLSLKNANKRSAPGADGLSNFILDMFWPFLRSPLLKSFNEMIIDGKLKYNFSLVTIKLIPKKGIINDINQWRPISLLPCAYKIISGAICSRLNSVADKLINVRQKGFSSTKILQNNLLNVFEAISHLNASEIDAALCCVDFKKAFDSISHDYILKVFKFFNFGDNFIRLITTIISGKQGRINVDGSFTPLFDFESGSGQGDNSSPLIFNLAIEILLCKLIACNMILVDNLQKDTRSHSLNLTNSEAFADDENLLINPTGENLARLRIIFNDFKSLSGLEINENKTQLIPLGSNRHDLERFRNRMRNLCSYEVTDSTKILGITFNSNLDNINSNWHNAFEKMENIIKFWKQFNLSIIGRVNIAKTYLLPQLSFIANCLPINDDLVKLNESLIIKFIKNKDILSKERINADKCTGGLGFPPLGQFLKINKSRLIRKFMLVEGDPLKDFLYQISHNFNDFDFKVDTFNFSYDFPYYGDIIECYKMTKNLIFSNNDFIINSPIFYNTIISPDILRPTSVMTASPIHERILKLTFNDFIINDHIVGSNIVLAAVKDIHINNIEFFRLSSYVRKVNQKYNLVNKNDDNFKPPFSVITSKKKTGKFFRKFYTSEANNKNFLRKFELDENTKIPLAQLVNVSFFPHSHMVFIIKVLSNRLLFNSQLFHIDASYDQGCLSCIFSQNRPPEKETFAHLIKHCPGTQWLRNFAYQDLFNDTFGPLTQQDIIVGKNFNSLYKNLTGNTLIFLIWTFIYMYRRTQFLQDRDFFINFMVENISEIFFTRKYILLQFNAILNPMNGIYESIVLKNDLR